MCVYRIDGKTRLGKVNNFCLLLGRCSASSDNSAIPARPDSTRKPTIRLNCHRTCRLPRLRIERTPCWAPATLASYPAARTTQPASRHPCPTRTCTTATVTADHTGMFRDSDLIPIGNLSFLRIITIINSFVVRYV